MLTITLLRSRIGCTPKQRQTLDALGLQKIRQARSFDDSASVRGMIDKVQHLVEVKQS
jgi:large subunit ribosomal protein L30